MEESISLEETNKIRISLGLKPLTDDKAPADSDEKRAEDNYAKRRAEEQAEKERKKIQDRIAKVKNRRELNASLKGTTLGDPEDIDEDTLKWIKKAKKKEKELAKKRQQELENMDKQFQEEYTEKDLAGLKVSHDFDELEEGEDRILTLKDSRILDGEEDELQNVEMAEDERTKKNSELKIKRRDYTGYDDEEFTEGQAGMKRSVLAKYDEDINGTAEMGFRLGSSFPKSSKATRELREQAAAAVNKSLLSIDYSKNQEINDYLQEGDIGFKKPKTKKKRPTRRAAEDSDIRPVANEGDKMDIDIDEKPVVPRPKPLDDNFVDDDELQAALARQRRSKLKRSTVKLTPEELARRVIGDQTPVEAEEDTDGIKLEPDEDGEGEGLTIDDTSEFVRQISFNPVKAEAVKAEPADGLLHSSQPADHPMRDVEEDTVDELEAGEVRMKEEEIDEEAILNALEDAMHAAENVKKENGEDISVGTSSEQPFGPGLASTLNILRQQGILTPANADMQEREEVQQRRDLFLAAQRSQRAKYELERTKSRGEKKDQAQREYENRLREQRELRESTEMFKDYKPDVNIVYHDEFGRELTHKEAWKALSHRFHGKGSGKAKTEKRLKKIAEERKKEAMASGDTPLSMNKAFQMRQEKTGQAHFVLSVGNRGAVPQATEFLEPPTLSKGKTEKTKNKKKEATKGEGSVDITGFTAFPGARALSIGAEPPNDVSNEERGSNSPAPSSMMKPSFSRVSEPASGSATPSGPTGDRTKVAFGFGTKRKAGEDASGSPPTKKR